MEKLIKISLDETEKQYIKERASKNVRLMATNPVAVSRSGVDIWDFYNCII